MADLVIIGGGPAGVSASLYAARGGVSTKIITKNTGAVSYTHLDVYKRQVIVRISGKGASSCQADKNKGFQSPVFF